MNQYFKRGKTMLRLVCEFVVVTITLWSPVAPLARHPVLTHRQPLLCPSCLRYHVQQQAARHIVYFVIIIIIIINLGSVVSESGGTEEDVASRNKKANGVFFQLYPVWRNFNISKEVKI
jgi:hypothetical protein